MARLNKPWRRVSVASFSWVRAFAAMRVPFESFRGRPAALFRLAMTLKYSHPFLRQAPSFRLPQPTAVPAQDTSLDFPDRALSRRSSRRFRCSWGTGKLSTSGLRLSQRNSNIFNFSVGANAANSAVLMPLVCNNPRQSQPRYSPIFSLPKNPRVRLPNPKSRIHNPKFPPTPFPTLAAVA